MKLDLHNYLTIGFQPYWLRVQNYNPETLLEQTVNQCFSKGIDVCGITSKEFMIPKGSVHDRFAYLLAQTKNLSKEYSHDGIDDVALIVEKDGKKVVLLNVQGVISKNKEGRRIDYLTIGGNQLENNLLLGDSLNEAKQKGLLTLVHHPFLLSGMYCGMPEEELKSYWSKFDAIVVHDAQTPFPLNLLIRSNVKKGERFARQKGIHMVAVSGAHKISDIGTSYIQSNLDIELLGKDYLLRSLNNIIKNSKLNKNNISLISYIDWYSKFRKGIKNPESINTS